MEIIPVLDIRGGRAVAGKGGRREEYRDLETVFYPSPDPLEIARRMPYERLYVADLDGVVHGKPDIPLLEELAGVKKLMVDVGVRTPLDLERISRLDAEIILGTETMGEALLAELEGDEIVSLDMKQEAVISSFLPTPPLEALEVLKGHGASRFILLEIGAVGTLSGTSFGYLRGLDKRGLEIYVGGGIRGEDIEYLEKLGVDGTLVGTALHRGLIRP